MGRSKGKSSKKEGQKGTGDIGVSPDSAAADRLSSDLKEVVDLSNDEGSSTSCAQTSNGLQCPICKVFAVSRCGGCNNVAYCSREHQKQHWKVHKGECVLWKVAESPQLGRYLIATRDIKAGTVILQEKPLLLTPPRITTPVCLGCYNELLPPEDIQEGDQDVRPCSCSKDCGWPMCSSESCKASRVDHEAECKISMARGGVNIRNFGQDHPMYQAVGILRVLALKKNRPEDYEKLLKLQSHEEKRKEIPLEESGSDIGMAVSLIQNFFKQGEDGGVTDKLIAKISGIIETNGHEIPLPGNYGQLNRRLIGVYNVASLLEHNCRPNCVKGWESKTLELIIRSSIPIKKGDHLSISYVDPLWGTTDRQNFLQMTKFFTCKCERCLDPTELKCHISSLRCQQIQCTSKFEVEEKSGIQMSSTGMIVPDDPLNPESPWKCITCEENYPVKYPASIVEKIGREVEEFQEKRGDITAEEEFIRKFSKTLSHSHFYLLEIKVELAQLYGRTADEPLPMLPPLKLLRKRALCEEVLRVLNVIVPGYNRLRALILYELQATLGTISKLKHSCGDISTDTHIDDLLRCKQLLAEVTKVLAWEPELSVEYRRCEGAKRELTELEALIEEAQAARKHAQILSSNPLLPQPLELMPNSLNTTPTLDEPEEELELF